MKYKKTFTALSVMLFAGILLFEFNGMGADNEETGDYLKNPGIYADIINYLRMEKKEINYAPIDPAITATVFAIDLVVAGFLLWFTMFLTTTTRSLNVKQYAWFLFIFNLGWFIVLLIFKMCWAMLDFLVIRLRPEFRLPVLDTFTFIVIVVAVMVYIWLLARTFSVGFLVSVKTTLLFHLFYFVIIAFVIFAAPKNKVVARYMGIDAVIRSYLVDVNRLTTGGSMVSLLRIRPFHI